MTNPKTPKKLYDAVNAAIEKAATDKKQFYNESINWGDLSCVQIEPLDKGYRVYIEELSPTCIKFRESIEDELFEQGFRQVEVYMEW